MLSDTLASIPTLETQLRQAGNGLCVLLGLPPGDLAQELKGPSEIPVSPPEIVVGIPNDLLRRRPDVRSAEYQAAAQSAQIGVAKADLYPAFSLSGMFGFLSSDVNNFSLGDMFAWKSRNYQFGPSVQWSIFNYGRIRNNVRAQDARFEELLIAYRNTVLKAHREVEDALVAFLKAQERAAHLRAGTEAAKSALDMVVEQYREGIRDFTAVSGGAAGPFERAGQPGRHPRQPFVQPGGGLQGARGRMGDSGRQGACASRRERRDGKTDRLGEAARSGGIREARRGS